MHDLLVSYLLGEVDGEQRALMEARLRDDPNLRRKLEHLRHCMGLNDGASANCSEPPANLAQRTSERVASVAESGDFDPGSAAFSSLGFVASGRESNETSGSWTVADLTVATGVVLAIGMLLLPALHDSRSASRRLECQDHLRQLGFALAHYSIDNQRWLPPRQNEHAGMFSLHLVSGGYFDRDQITGVLICPSSTLAEDVRSGRLTFQMPTIEEFNKSQGSQRMRFAHMTGGSYAYRLGYVKNGEYRSLRNTFCPKVPMMADPPTTDPVDLVRGEFSSGNHGGYGENVLFQDLSVKYQVEFVTPQGEDHPYLNHDGLVAPSDDPADTVLARSYVTPRFPARDKTLTRDRAAKFHFQVVPFHAQ